MLINYFVKMRYVLVALSVIVVLTPAYGKPQFPISSLNNVVTEVGNLATTTTELGLGSLTGAIAQVKEGLNKALQDTLEQLFSAIKTFANTADAYGKLLEDIFGETFIVEPTVEALEKIAKFVATSSRNNDSSDSFPSQLAQYLRVAPKGSNAHNTHTSDSQDSGSGEPLIAPEDIKKSPPSSPPPKQVTTSSGPKILPKSTSTPTSKISLVPTNILLKPQAQKMALNTGPTFFMKNSTTGAVQAISSVANSQTGMPMKVLLVNTLPKSTAPAPTIISKASQVMTHATPVTTSADIRGQNSPNFRRNSTWKVPPKPSTIGFRTLLTQVIQQQNLSLQVARERLAVERERLAFEKATGEKLLEVLPLLQSISDHVTGRRTSQRLKKPANSISHDSDD
uniref:Putative transcription factor gt-2 n=1 Tax=Lutzomyia longipalpis TaxID=7200 RepID=A0A1B0CEH7_LUTLO